MKRIIILSAVAVGLVLGSPGARAGSGTTYQPDSYQAGPTGGDTEAKPNRTAYRNVDPSTGTVTVLWANTTPGAIGCAATGGFGYLRVLHKVTSPVTKVAVAYDKATITPFTWLKANVRGLVKGVDTYIGSAALRGQMANDGGTLVIPLDKAPDAGSVMTIDFGIETASACPNADGGTATFPTVAVF
ncbi:MAG: hypothetical protein QOK43_2418 [Acidimicrobiaceae bacterium]|jgi:hypothetical protein|nr:hypothetical protein [Acidimicrobiaceae bacterium]MDQ1444554.1 hypothetical protein [Acidimicrobiaceae bacterium]